MTATRWKVRAGAYFDSVVLMQLQRGLLGLPGVVDAGVVMATQANRDLLAANDLLPNSISASPDDLLVVVKADSEAHALAAIDQMDDLLARRKSSAVSGDFHPRSMGIAIKNLPQANWVLISVPGRYAAGIAHEAIDLDKNVFLYSDNVSLADETSLKIRAREKGLLVMGPDCGTAIINGIGLGFANRVRRGPVGVIGASGTGTQAVTSHLHNLGVGISHAIGTGGRDLKSEVGAITALQALNLLARDPETRAIVLLSKPPSPEIATKLISESLTTGKPVVVYFIGYPAPARRIGNLQFAVSLVEAAEMAMDMEKNDFQSHQISPIRRPWLRGLFSGGTLAYETLIGLQGTLSPLYSNSPVTESQFLKDPLKSESHTIVDLGDEYFMVGRLHPMIDNDLRMRRMRQEAADPEVGMILFDVVLGEGSHINPAADLVPVIQEIRGERPEVEFVAVVIGTDEDPQDVGAQIDHLKSAGVVVFRSVSEIVEYISLRFGRAAGSSGFLPINLDQFKQPLAAINLGLESFYQSLVAQGARAVHVDWRPPAGGNEKLANLLAKMK